MSFCLHKNEILHKCLLYTLVIFVAVYIHQPCSAICQVNPTVVEQLEGSGMLFVGHDDEGKRMEIMELQGTVS